MGYTDTQQAYVLSNGRSPTSSAWIDKRDPTDNDVNYRIGQFWINTADLTLWYLNSQSNMSGILQSTWLLISVASSLLEGLIPDAFTAPGTNPVLPNSGHNIILEGGSTFSTGTTPNPIRTNSLAANAMDFQIQLAGSNPSVSTANNFGVAQFDSNEFTVTNGYVRSINPNYTGTATTVGATTANINITLPVATNTALTVRASLVGWDATSNLAVGGELIALAKNVAGTVSVIQQPDLTKNNDMTVSAWSANLIQSGTDVLVQVTGVTGQTINWRAFIDTLTAP